MKNTPTISLFESRIRSVEKFNKYFGLPLESVPTNLEESIMRAKIGFIESELVELEEALKNNSRIDILDALGDIEYFLHGLVGAYGLNDKFIAYMRADAIHYHYEMATGTFVEQPLIYDNIASIRACMRELSGIPNHALNSLAYINSLIIEMADAAGLCPKFQKAFEIIHASNMSKLCINEEECMRTVLKLEGIESTLENVSEIFGESVNYSFEKLDENLYKVISRGTGKIQKSVNYVKPDLVVLF